MGSNLERARELAARPYQVIVQRDFGSEDHTLFVAFHPEMPRCVAQGESADEARALLNEVRVEYISHLLRFSLPIPDPVIAEFRAAPETSPSVDVKVTRVSGASEPPVVDAVMGVGEPT